MSQKTTNQNEVTLVIEAKKYHKKYKMYNTKMSAIRVLSPKTNFHFFVLDDLPTSPPPAPEKIKYRSNNWQKPI